MALKPITPQSVDRFTCLIIGTAGIGKTSLIRTIPKNEKALILSSESGLLCVKDLVDANLLQGFEIGSFAEMKEAYQYLLSPEGLEFSYVFIDSLSEISARAVESLKVKYPSKSDSFSLWGDYNTTMTSLIKGFRDLRTHSVVFTCLPSIEKDESNRRFVGPSISGKDLKEKLTSYFDICLYMVSQQTEDGTDYRCFLTQASENYPAKDRSGKLAPIEKPDLTHIKTKILGGTN